MGEGDGDDRGWERRIERETGVGERDTGKKERERERYRGEREGETGEKERERERGERKKLQTQKSLWNFILSCFTPQNGVKHDSGL